MPHNSLVRELKYHYTEKEHLAQGQLLSEKLREREHLEAQLAQIKTDFKGRIEAIAAAANLHAENVRRGYEFRSTECTAYLDVPRRGMKTIVRIDTGEVVGDENMTPADRQMVMQWESKRAAEEGESGEAQNDPAEVATASEEASNVVEFPGQHPDPTDQGQEKEEAGEEETEVEPEPEYQLEPEPGDDDNANEPETDRTEIQG